MMKKTIYIVIFIVIIIMGYLNYFSDEKLPDDIGQKIETIDVNYDNEDYHVEAKKQIDFIKTKETRFEIGKIIILKNDTTLSGDNIYIDKNNNLELNNNIIGVSNNGWRIESEQLKYIKDRDEITSDIGITAINQERKLKISGKHYKSDSKITYIDLENDIIIENDRIQITGDKGSYNEANKIITLEGKIKLEGYDSSNNVIEGEFIKFVYNVDTKTMRSDDEFYLLYKTIKLIGKKMSLDENDGSFTITDDVSFEAGNYKIYASKIERLPNDDKVKMYGSIYGGNDEYNINAGYGEYSISEKKLYILENVELVSTNGDKLTGDIITFDNNINELEVYCNENKKVEYTSKDGKLITKKLRYDTVKKVVIIEEPYEFDGPQYQSMGNKAKYNLNDKVGYISEGYIFDKVKKQRVAGNTIDGNVENKIYKVRENVQIENENYKLSADYVEYNEASGKSKIDGPYNVYMIKRDMTYIGEDATYDNLTGEFLDTGIVKIVGKDYAITGEDISYNEKEGVGDVKSQVIMKNDRNGTVITAEKFTFIRDTEIRITGNIIMENDQVIAKTIDGNYDLKTEKIYFPNEIVIESKDKTFNGKVQGGVYDNLKEIFFGNKVDGKYLEYLISSDNIEYFIKMEKIAFVNNAKVESTINIKNRLYGKRLEYTIKGKIIAAYGGYRAYYENYAINGINCLYNMSAGLFNGNKVVINSEEGDHFEAEKADGRMSEMRIDFIGNAKANVKRDDEITNFRGDFVRIYAKKVGDQYTPTRSEIRKNVAIIQKEREFYGDFIEYNFDKKLVYAKDNIKIITNDEKNGHTEATGNIVNANINNDIATLTGDVYIKNIDTKKEISEIRSEQAKINKKDGTVTLINNVRIENKDGIVTADTAVYDMNTKKAKAKGNVYIEYKNKK
ncbi:MAG: LPS export ABC transporter periplasmic protein LptC [Fusobacteriaceae bacterium]|nr:LPS export ABC transporter periplasmic protein LptC [Fusobacteriaceae bacterium]